MLKGLTSDRRDRSRLYRIADPAFIFVLVLALHLAMMVRFPIIYGGDTVLRIVNFPKILIAYQLPLLQILLHYTMRGFDGPAGIWTLMGVLSGFAGAGLYALTREMTQDRSSAWVAAVLYATHPFVLFYSLVPYQEPLLLAGILWGFFYLFRASQGPDSLRASIVLGMACFTRYEAWIAAAAAFLFRLFQMKEREGKISWRTSIQSLALFGWAPISWILFSRGLSPLGTFVLDMELDWARLYRPYFVAKSALWWTEPAVVVMALVGFAFTRVDLRMRGDRRFHFILVFLLLFFAALIASGHGIQPDPRRLVTEREAFVPIGLLALYAGIGGSRLSAGLQPILAAAPAVRRLVLMVALLSVAAYSLNEGIHRVARANEDPELKTDYEVAQFLVKKHSCALVLARPLPANEVQNYLRGAEKAGGLEGKRMAEQILSRVETSPLDYQRLLVFSWLGKDRLIAGNRLQGLDRFGIENFIRGHQIEYLVVFSDFISVGDHERLILSLYTEGRAPEFEIRNGSKAARIFHMRQ